MYEVGSLIGWTEISANLRKARYILSQTFKYE